MQYAPTRDNRKRKMNNEKIRYPAKLAGIPDALIFFSHPFLVSRQEKDVGVRGATPPPSMLYAPACKNLTLPIVLNPPLPGRFVGRIQYAPTLTDENRESNHHAPAPIGSFVGRMLLRPYRGHRKWGILSPFEAIFVRIDGLPSRPQPRARCTIRFRTC